MIEASCEGPRTIRETQDPLRAMCVRLIVESLEYLPSLSGRAYAA